MNAILRGPARGPLRQLRGKEERRSETQGGGRVPEPLRKGETEGWGKRPASPTPPRKPPNPAPPKKS